MNPTPAEALSPVQSLGRLYDGWVKELLGADIPRETVATCDNCVMCPSGDSSPPSGVKSFSPNTKCCTYWPFLPNYLVGAILSEPEVPLGREKAARMLAFNWSTPRGIEPSTSRFLLYDSAGSAEFGRSKDLLCPYYDGTNGGSCTVWPFRNSVCTTWFCKHDRGRIGSDFWSSIRRTLGKVEETLSVWCGLELGIQPEWLRPRSKEQRHLHQPLDGEPVAEVERERWRHWLGRKAELYVAAYQLVRPLKWSDVRTLGGASLNLECQELLQRFRAFDQPPGDAHLRFGSPKLLAVTPDYVLLYTYSPNDPQAVSTVLFALIQKWPGGSYRDAVEYFGIQGGFEHPAILVRRLIDYDLFVKA